MHKYYSLLIGLFFLASQSHSQNNYIIPANTGYAVPSENEDHDLFESGKPISKWTDLQQELQYFVHLKKSGSLQISLNTRNTVATAVLSIKFAEKYFLVTVPKSETFVKLHVGNLMIKDSGFYVIEIKGLKKTGKIIAEIASIELSGSATEGIHFNKKERRNAASVHLRYPLADTIKAITFYNEITIPAHADIVHSYYMSNGFARGYFGIQVNSDQERRVIFSVWDAGNEALHRTKVADSNKVKLLVKGEDVIADDFGNEGTGGHSHWVYPWKTGMTYKMVVTALPDSISQTTTYTGYFFIPEIQKWKLIASFRAPRDGGYLRNLYSFNENFVGSNGQLERKAYFGNQWIQRENGTWLELTQSTFSDDATGKAGDRIDYGGGVQEGKFYLWNGGFQKTNTSYGELFSRLAENQKPIIDYSKNADSLIQATMDQQMIYQAISNKQLDTSGMKEGIYYQTIKNGFGEEISLSDTVTVFYKGYLLKDKRIFDQTKDKPVVFPLNRLIKGWQIGLVKTKVGSKIRLIIPSGLAYNIRCRSKDIAPNSVLVFDIEVVNTKR